MPCERTTMPPVAVCPTAQPDLQARPKASRGGRPNLDGGALATKRHSESDAGDSIARRFHQEASS